MAERILALDLSATTGVAFLARGLRPIWRVWHLLGPEGKRFAGFENELAAAVEELEPDVLVLEAPLSLQAISNAHAVNQQRGLRAIAYSEAYRASLRVFEVDAGTVRQEVLGRRTWPKGEAKAAVVAWCRARGWPVSDHNAADAILLGCYHAGIARWRPAEGGAA